MTALAAIQATNFILPLLTIPYVIITVGEIRFGTVTFAQSFFSYLLYIVDYGFNITITRDISLHKEDKNYLNRVVSDVLSIKVILIFVTALITVISIFFIPKFRTEAWVYYGGFLLVVGQAFVPLWFYQGIEKMQYLTYANVLGKVFFTFLIFILVKTPNDYIYILPLYALGNLLSGIFGVFWMFYHFGISWKKPSKPSIFHQLKASWYPFVSNFSINSYINANILILGFLTNDTLVGYYSIADRLISALKQLLVVFFQATYPTACRIALQGHTALLHFFKKLAYPFCITVLLGCLWLFVFSEELTFLLTKKNIPQVSTLIEMLSFILFVISLNIPAYQTLLAYNYQRSYTKVFVVGSLFNIMINFALTSSFNIYGTAWAVILTELFITVGLYAILHISHYKHKIL
jgi:PST family polysaccharide transporter